ncbi:hypothetical protein CRUP_035343 [Coryphaenoides rupestris]|nr:hypothetical protein CRUP_035343 [Coryphaenoides rupestris]
MQLSPVPVAEMEWREQTSVSCKDAFDETRRWIEDVTSKSFGSGNFRAALENGVLLCDLMNKLKPGIIKRLNRLSTPIAGLDNVNVFLKACSKLGLNESQLFHPGDLQDLSTRATLRREEGNRRLKKRESLLVCDVLITVYWLGRRAQLDPFYCGPQLCFKAFEGLLGLALSKALEEGSGLCPRDGAVAEKESGCRVLRPPYRRDDSLEIPEYGDHRGRAHRPGSEGSDVEADQVFSMSTQQQRDRCSVPPALLRRKRGREEGGRGCPSTLISGHTTSPYSIRWYREDSSSSPSDEEEAGEADPVADDLFARRLRQHHHQTTAPRRDHDLFLPRLWTPEEAARVRVVLGGSRRRPWYRRYLLAGMPVD